MNSDERRWKEWGLNGVHRRLKFLEHQLQRELNLPGWIGAADSAEGGVGNVGIRQAEIRAIQNVEELRTELERHAFARRNPEALVHADVPLPETWSAQ